MRSVLSTKSDIVLPRESKLILDWEIRFDAAESPYDFFGVFRDLVYRISMPTRIEVVAVVCLVDRIRVTDARQRMYTIALTSPTELTDSPNCRGRIAFRPRLQ